MEELKDFIFVKKTNIVGGVHNSNSMTKGALFLTKRFIFVVPRKVLEFAGDVKKDSDADDFINSILEKASVKPVEAFEAEMFSELSEENIYPIDQLEVFKVWVGFGPFGNLFIKKKGDIKKAFNVHPMGMRKKIKLFYGK